MFWSNLFKKKAKSTIISNSNYSDIPSFDDLSNEEKEYVDKLKEEYIKFYDESINFTDLDNDLFSNIKINQDLALDIMHKDHLGNILDSLIDSKKLVYYAHKIKEENSALKYKYIALKELRKNKKYLTKYMSLYILGKKKINILKAIDHQMNIINNLLVVTDSDIYNYNACAMASYPNINNQNVDEELDKRYKDVSKDYNNLFCKTLNINEELLVSDKVTYAELLIDKFVYENKDLIDKLKEQLDVIANSEIKDEKEQSKIIDNLMKIKMYYNIFNKYGRFKLTEKDFTDLYQIIFNVYTYFPCNGRFSEYYDLLQYKEENKFEINTYNKMILYKAELFRNNKSRIFKKYSNLDDFKKILINQNLLDESYYELICKTIIHDYLDLLLIMDYEEGFNMYFEKHKNDTVYVKYMDTNLSLSEYYKLLIGVKKSLKMNDMHMIKKLNKLLKFIYDDIDSMNIKPFLDIYEKIYFIDFNKFPIGISEKYIGDILNYYYYDFTRPVILPHDNNNIYINTFYKQPLILICDNDSQNIYIHDKCVEGIKEKSYTEYEEDKIDINITYETQLLKILLSKNINNLIIYKNLYESNYKKAMPIRFYPDNMDYQYLISIRDFKNELKNIGNLIILNEKILLFDEVLLQKYLYNLFNSIKNTYIYNMNCLNRLEKGRNIEDDLIDAWSLLFENLCIGNETGKYHKIKYTTPRYVSGKYISNFDSEDSYELCISALTSSLIKYKESKNDKKFKK